MIDRLDLSPTTVGKLLNDTAYLDCIRALRQPQERALEHIEVTWSSRMISCAGRCRIKRGVIGPQRASIRLSTRLLECSEEEIITTVLHETAHALEYSRAFPMSHSQSWRRAFRDLGWRGPINRTHALRAFEKGKIHVASCECGIKVHKMRPTLKTWGPDSGARRHNRCPAGGKIEMTDWWRTKR